MNTDKETSYGIGNGKYIIIGAVVILLAIVTMLKIPGKSEKVVETTVNLWREGKVEEVQNMLGPDTLDLSTSEQEVKELIGAQGMTEEFTNTVMNMLRLVKVKPHSKEVKINSTTREIEVGVQYLDIDAVLSEIKIIEANSEYEKGSEPYQNHLMQMLMKWTPIKTDVIGVKVENIGGKWLIVSNNLPRILLGGYDSRDSEPKPKTVEELDNLGTTDGILNEVEQQIESEGHDKGDMFDYTEFIESQKHVKIPDPNTPFEEWDLNWIKTPDDSHLKETHVYDSPDSFIIESNEK